MRTVRTLATAILVLAAFAAGGALGPARAQGARVALLIANAAYPDSDAELPTPVNDAVALSEELVRRGFTVEVARNLNKDGLQGTVDGFLRKVEPGSVALVFYSGYAIQAGRKNYLVPVDARIWSESDVLKEGLGTDTILAGAAKRGAATRVLILDASRRNPFERRYRSFSTGLAPSAAQPGNLVLYSAAAGSVANETAATRSLFVTELVKQIGLPGLDAEQAFGAVREALSRATRSQQVPVLVSGLEESFSFDPTYVKPPTPKPAPSPVEEPAAPPPEAKQPPPAAKRPPAPEVAALPPEVKPLPPEVKPLPPEPKRPEPEVALPPPEAKQPPAAAKRPPVPEVAVLPPEATQPPPEPKRPAPGDAPPAVEAKRPPVEAKLPPVEPRRPPPAVEPDPPVVVDRDRLPADIAEEPSPPEPGPAADLPGAKPPGAGKPSAPVQTATKDPEATLPPEPPPEPARKPYSSAERQRKAALDQRIARNPRDEQAYYERGQFHAQRGEAGPAIADFDESIRMKPDNPEAFNNRCWMRAVAEDLQRALSDCDQALKLRPGYVDALDSRGFVNLKASRFRAAVADYDAALKLDPGHSSAFYGRGIARRRLGQTAQAEQDIASALQLNATIGTEFAGYGLR